MKVKVYVIDLEVPTKVKKWGLRIGIPALVLSVAAVALAAPISFTDGQTLKASDLNNNFSYLVPSGAVVAFNLSACPSGWSALTAAQGRTIIGVNFPAANGLSQRNLGDTLGEEQHTMTVAEMPNHTHEQTAWGGTTGSAVDNPASATGNMQFGVSNGTGGTGGGSPFNNMQPSLALLYCSKN